LYVPRNGRRTSKWKIDEQPCEQQVSASGGALGVCVTLWVVADGYWLISLFSVRE
jgi:hypothetical protein